MAITSNAGPLLSFETLHSTASVALWHEGVVVASHHLEEPSRQAEQLIVMIESVLSEASITYADLAGIVVPVGPGSFTGVRITLATALALAHAASVPVMGVTLFDVIAHQQIQSKEGAGCDEYAIALNAHRGQVYLQSYHNGKSIDAPLLLTMNDMFRVMEREKKPLFTDLDVPLVEAAYHTYLPSVQEGAAPENVFSSRFVTLPKADNIACYGAQYGDASLPVRPLYIRAPDAKKMKKTL
jgi:tRNA threonylcarbamoyladenosine biosynthesis protein TsaB